MKKIYAVIAILLVFALAGCAIVSPIENPPSKEETSSVNETSSEEISSIEETSSVDETPTFEVPESTYVVTQKTAEEKNEIKRARILILGDSFTAGDGTESAFRYALFENLYENGGYFKFLGDKTSTDVRLTSPYQNHMGQGGRTTEQLEQTYAGKVANGKMEYDIALVLIGLNDFYHGATVNVFEERYVTLLNTIYNDRPDIKVFCSQIPNVTNLPDVIINEANKKVKATVEAFAQKGMKVEYIELLDFDKNKDLQNVEPSGSHPSISGNQKLGKAYADAMLETVLELNKEPAPQGQKAVADPESITVTATEKTIMVTEQTSISYKVSPSGSDVVSAIWTSSDESVATINEYGIITAHKAGTTVVTARVVGTNIRAHCLVTVTEDTFEKSPAGEDTLLQEPFLNASKWTGDTRMIGGGILKKYYEDTLEVKTKDSFTISKDAGSVSFSAIASGHLGHNSTKYYWAMYIGEYEIRILNNMKEIRLLCNGKTLGAYEGQPYCYPYDNFLLNFVDGKVTLYRNNEILVTADAPCDANGAIEIVSYQNGTFGLKNLIVKSGK